MSRRLTLSQRTRALQSSSKKRTPRRRKWLCKSQLRRRIRRTRRIGRRMRKRPRGSMRSRLSSLKVERVTRTIAMMKAGSSLSPNRKSKRRLSKNPPLSLRKHHRSLKVSNSKRVRSYRPSISAR